MKDHEKLDAWIDAHFDEEVRFLQELVRVHGWDARTQRYHFSQIQSLQEVYDETQSDVFHNNDWVGAAAGDKLGRHGRNGLTVGSTDDHD